MIMDMNRNQKGDTIVEVLLASAILSLVLAGAFTLSNRATRLNQTAHERTVVSNLIQREVELIKASSLQDGVTGFWANFTAPSSIAFSAKDVNTAFCDSATGSAPRFGNAFYMTDPVAKPDPTPDEPIKVELITEHPITNAVEDNDTTDLFDIWVEAVDGLPTTPPSSPTVKYTDFFVYACWEGIGGETMQSSGLVLRLARP